MEGFDRPSAAQEQRRTRMKTLKSLERAIKKAFTEEMMEVTKYQKEQEQGGGYFLYEKIEKHEYAAEILSFFLPPDSTEKIQRRQRLRRQSIRFQSFARQRRARMRPLAGSRTRNASRRKCAQHFLRRSLTRLAPRAKDNQV
jgi:hypothetical protein